MEFADLHSWEMGYGEAVALQRRLAEGIELRVPPGWKPRLVAGVDVSYEKHGDLFFAGVVVLQLPELNLVGTAAARGRVTFPYIPGLLSFRELPVLLDAFRSLTQVPDAVLVDGQGIAHPRRLGLASHLGLWLGIPTVGCAKSRLCGEHPPPGNRRGDRVPLRHGRGGDRRRPDHPRPRQAPLHLSRVPHGYRPRGLPHSGLWRPLPLAGTDPPSPPADQPPAPRRPNRRLNQCLPG